MNPPRLTLTTVGLSIRDELRVKSMLHLVEGKTAAAWTYVEETQADLAICEPESALARVTIRHAAERGRPRCVMLLRQGAPELPDAHCVFAPLRVSDFISLLDGAPAVQTQEATVTQSVDRAESTDPQVGELFAHLLRRIVSEKDGRARCITVGDMRLYLLMSQNSVLANESLTPERIAGLSGRRDFEASLLTESERITPEDNFHRCALPVFLWNCAIGNAADGLQSWLPRGAAFTLKRWPDFGRLSHQPWHLRLTALLVREAFTPQQMSVLVEQPPSAIEAFLHACDLCGLLSMGSHAEAPEESSVTATTESSGRWSTIFRSLRQALNMGKR